MLFVAIVCCLKLQCVRLVDSVSGYVHRGIEKRKRKGIGHVFFHRNEFDGCVAFLSRGLLLSG